MKIIVATSNKGKIKEFREILKDYEVLTLEDLNYNFEIVEDGTTFEENSFIKASTISKYYNIPCIADDSGLCIKSLDNRPGIYSARYKGITNTSLKNKEVLNELNGIKDRSAFFVSVICLVRPNKDPLYFRGELYGNIIDKELGANGFGYDPLFVPNDYTNTLAELDSSVKNQISHRAKSTRLLMEYLNENPLC